MTVREPIDWERRYREEPVEDMAWYHPELDPDLAEALERLGREADGGTRFLDLGTGPATQALALAERGYTVTGVDVAGAAVERADALVAERGLGGLCFVRANVLEDPLPGPVEAALDRGCFHGVAPEARARYVKRIADLIVPGGHLFLKCFAFTEPGDEGPYRFTPADVVALFRPRFRVRSIKHTAFQGTLDVWPRALFCTLERRT